MTGAWEKRGVVTRKFDATRASLGATGALNSATAGVVAVAVNEHIAAHRRYVRLDLSDVTSVDDEAVAVLAEIHSRLLAERGTLILTGVDPGLEMVLAGADHAFLMIAPTAADGI
jgi:anti-anti-sigma regulatory factor